MRLFLKSLIVIKTGKNKIEVLTFWKNWCQISIFQPVSPKLKNPHKFTNLNFLMLNETILEMPYCQLNFSKTGLKLPFGRGPSC